MSRGTRLPLRRADPRGGNSIARIAGHDDKLLDLIGEVQGMLDLDELIEGMLAALQRNVPSEYVSINDIGPDPERVVAVIVPPQPEDLYRAYGEFAHQNPLTIRYATTLDGRPYRFSDVTTAAELHELDIYRTVYAPLGVEYQMAFTLPATPGRILGVALSRRERDYSDQERSLIERARPFLIQSWRNALEHTALREELGRRSLAEEAPRDGAVTAALRRRGLTGRQAEVLQLVARGRSSRDAAAILAISGRTVQKHLERCYRTLGVSGRSAASELVWSLVAEAGVAETPPRRSGLENRPQA
jgi:DNA-binding CsgD family transcriptional regulator